MSATNVKWVRLGDYIERSMVNVCTKTAIHLNTTTKFLSK